MGMFLANIYERSKTSKMGVVYFALGIVLGAYPLNGIPASGMYRWVYDVVLTKINALANRNIGVNVLYILGVFFILLGVIKCDWLKKVFSCKAIHYIGTLSMYIYICHIPVIWSLGAYVFYKLYSEGNHIFVSASVCAGVSIVVSIVGSMVLKKVDDTFIGQRVRDFVHKILE